MKRVTKVTAFLLALVLTLGCSINAFASGVDETSAELPHTEEVTEIVTEPAGEFLTESETEALTVTEPVTGNETGQPAETETEAEPVTGTEAEPVTETGTEPVTETEAEPVTEPTAEPESELTEEPESELTDGSETEEADSTIEDLEGSVNQAAVYADNVTGIAYAGSIAGTIARGNGGGTSSSMTEPTPNITKTATKSDRDYTYDLALTVSSSVGSSESRVAIDLLFIVDKSGSMGNDNIIGETRQAVADLTNTLANDSDLDMQFAVVAFSGSGGRYDQPYNDAETVQDWTGDASTIGRAVNNIRANGGTNYEAGLRKGKEVLLNARDFAYKYVIFLSDGAPTYYYNDQGLTAGNGSRLDTTAVAHAETMVKELAGINGFYTVYVTSDASTTGNQEYLIRLSNAIRSVDSEVSTGDEIYVKGSGGSLSDIFEGFSRSFTQISCTKVTVEDILSEWVVPVENEAPYVVIRVTDENGGVTIYSSRDGSLPAEEQGITASLTTAGSKNVLKLNFPENYKLKDNYVYEVHLNIEPSQKAIENGTDYTDTPDPNTGTHWTDGTQSGYYSNTAASLTYTVEGQTNSKSVEYPMPVIQVPPTRAVTIAKQVTGNMGDTIRQFIFTVTSTAAMDADTDGKYTLSNDGKTAAFTLSDGQSVTLNGVKKGSALTISEVSGGYEMTVRVGDTVLTAGTDGSYTYVIPTDGSDPISITVINNKEATIDTGILLDAIPYVLILVVAAAGAAFLLLRRRRNNEE